MRVKMTKALSLLLCLLMLVNMLPVSALASEATPDEPSAQTEQQPAECQHTGGSATCKALAVCDNCKQSYGEYAAHSGGTATCTALAVCETCGEGYGALAEHSYSGGVCTACNAADPNYVPPCEHTGGTATCTALAVCETCGEGYGALAEHSYSAGVCTVCNGADPDYVPPCEHTGGTATCTAQAVCTVCAAAYGELADHSYDNGVCVCGEVCAHAEYAEGKCTLCGAAQPEVACTCETDDPVYHAPFCALYERTGDACTCEVKCTEENHNIYCEVCYFDGIAACTGGEEDQIPYASSSCGTNVTYTLADGILTISGTGAMQDWDFSDHAPWFDDKDSIQSVVIEDGVTSIGNWAFSFCESLTRVTIAGSVTSIGDRAFSGCKSLTSVDIPGSVTSIGDGAFRECSVLTSVDIPDFVTSIGNSVFYNCIGLTSMTIGNSVKSIGTEAFCNCSSLTSVTIPNSVTSIGYEAFRDCTALTSVTIGNSVTSIGGGAFKSCSGLTIVDIPDSVTSIGGSAFSDCTALTSVTAPCKCTVSGKELYAGEETPLYTFDDSVTIDIAEHKAADTGAATCTKKAVCGTCGASYGELDMNNHSPAENVTYTDNGDGTHSFPCVCGTTVTEDHAFDENGTCVCGVNLFSVSGSTLTIDGTLGGKTEATEEDITVLVNKIQDCVDQGITTITVTGSNPAMIDMGSWTNTAIGEAIYRLSGSDGYDENNPYNGKIDLILPDVTEIVDQEFYSAWALNSITLPKVIKIGDEAFHRTWFLKTITFESVLTEVNETGGVMFAQVGKEVEGCDLILNCGQMNESSVPAPDLTNNIWKFKLENEFKSITLTHSTTAEDDKAATCISKAYCSVCKSEYGEVDADAHNYGDWVSNGDNTHTRTCANDNTHTENGDCSGGTATCTTLAVCDTCGKEYGELAAHTPDTNGKCTVDGCGYQYAAKVGDSFYESIHKALRAAEEINGCTLTLLDDITLTSTSSYASHVNTGTFTLDLNGKTLSSNKRTLEVMGSADLTIRDGIGGGKIVSTGGSAVYLSGGKLNIESGTFEGTLDGVFLSGDSTLTVKGGTFTGSRAMITGFGSDCVIDLTNIDPAGFTLKNNGSGTFAPTLPSGYAMINGSGEVVTSLSADESATVKASLENATVTLDKDTFTYDGQEHKPTVTVVLGDKPLTLGVDYTVIYAQAMTVQDGKPVKWFGPGPSESECINAGSFYFAVVEGIGNYYTEDTVTLCENFVIAPRPLTVKADDQTILVGGQINEESVTVTEGSLVAGHTLTASIQLGQYTEAGSVVNQPGFHEDVLTILELSCDIMDGEEYVTNNYSISFVSGNLTVVEHEHAWTYTAKDDTITATCANTDGHCPDAEQSITISAVGKTYDGTPVTATLTGSIDGVATPEITYTGNTNAGTHTASITIEGKTASVKFTIEKATVTVTADAKSKPYGTDNPTLTYTSEGLLGDDVLTGALETTATKTSNVGEYDITVGSLGSSNYTIDFVGAKLTITKADARITSEPQPVSGLTFNGGNQNLITAGTANGGTMQYRLSQNESFSSAISTGKNAGTYTVYYKVVGDANHNDSAEGSVTVTIAKATATAAKIPVQKHFHDYATANTLDLSQYLPADRGETTYTLDTITGSFFADGTAVTETGSLTYTTKVMEAAATGSIAVNMVMENYRDVTLTVPVELVAVTAQTETRIVKNGLTEVPAGLANTGFNTLEKLKAEQQRVLALRLGQDPQSSIAHYDVKLQFSPDGGKTWVDATEENFPAGGLTVTLPYPSGTGKDSHKFVVSHMFTTGNKAGTTETPAVTKTAEGIQFTVTGLSPVSVAWSAIPFDVSIGAVTNGTVYVSPAHTTAGTQVTITVIPKSGYKLSTLTVKDAAGNSYAVSTDNNGKYYFTMPAANVTVTATFSKISTATADPTNPKTGDDFGVIFWSGMMMTSLFGMAVMVLEKKKFYQR